MELQNIKDLLLYSFLFNMVLLIFWAGWLKFAKDFVFKLHNSFIPVSKESFYAIHYAGMMFFKMFIFAVFLMPYLALSFL